MKRTDNVEYHWSMPKTIELAVRKSTRRDKLTNSSICSTPRANISHLSDDRFSTGDWERNHNCKNDRGDFMRQLTDNRLRHLYRADETVLAEG